MTLSTLHIYCFVGKMGIDPYPKSPLLVLREHIVINDFRLIDLIQKADEDGKLSVTPEQFAAALQVNGLRFAEVFCS